MAILKFIRNTLITFLCVFLIYGVTPPLTYSQDIDSDNIADTLDNCPSVPNGPLGGTCTVGNRGDFCMTHGECGPQGFCSMNQEDTNPPRGNACGDACECEGNFDDDQDQDGSDAAAFKLDFGRSSFQRPCIDEDPCNGDFLCDGDVDGTDAALFKEDFGRSPFGNPCPICPTDSWCNSGLAEITWESLNGPYGGSVWVVQQDPDNPEMLYAGTQRGVYLSQDKGDNWN